MLKLNRMKINSSEPTKRHIIGRGSEDSPVLFPFIFSQGDCLGRLHKWNPWLLSVPLSRNHNNVCEFNLEGREGPGAFWGPRRVLAPSPFTPTPRRREPEASLGLLTARAPRARTEG